MGLGWLRHDKLKHIGHQAVGGAGGKSGRMIPCNDSQSSVGTISIASHGHPSRNAPSGPLLVHF